jgi:hypothetical protein
MATVWVTFFVSSVGCFLPRNKLGPAQAGPFSWMFFLGALAIAASTRFAHPDRMASTPGPEPDQAGKAVSPAPTPSSVSPAQSRARPGISPAPPRRPPRRRPPWRARPRSQWSPGCPRVAARPRSRRHSRRRPSRPTRCRVRPMQATFVPALMTASHSRRPRGHLFRRTLFAIRLHSAHVRKGPARRFDARAGVAPALRTCQRRFDHMRRARLRKIADLSAEVRPEIEDVRAFPVQPETMALGAGGGA